MKISVNSINEFNEQEKAATSISPNGVNALIEKIGSQLGEVEEVVDLGKKYKGVVVAKVISCVKHPNADRLKVCTIDDGGSAADVERLENGLVQVVCGAPNVAEGQLVAWLPPGAIVPATYDKDPFVLESRELRGERSNGMIASANELGVSDDHSGILVLESDIKPGDDFAKIFGLDDHIIDIENKMFTHRPDCFGMMGVARELAGIQQIPFTSPAWYMDSKEIGESSDDKDLLIVENSLPELVPRFVVQVIQNIEVKPSPLWLQIFLNKIGMKSINNIVDVTNYIMYLTGQPLHAFDYDKVAKLSGNKPTLNVRFPKKDENIKLLNGKTITPRSEAIMIATDKHAIALGGVMGGSETEVDGHTKNIILECANFDMYSIRRTSMYHGLFTDAVTRFSKGQSQLQNDKVISRAVSMVVEYAGGQPAKTVYDLKNKLIEPKEVALELDFINSRLGLELKAEQIVDLLRNVEFAAEITRGSVIVVKAPFWRTDIEIPEDVVEEVGRLYGFDNLNLELPSLKTSVSVIDEYINIKDYLRNKLAALGANELQNYSFVHGDLIEKSDQDKHEAFKISNALSPELQYYRMSIVPSLVEKVHPNIKLGYEKFGLFELGKVHGKSQVAEDGVPMEFGRVACVVTGDYFSAKKILENLLETSENLEYLQFKGSLLENHDLAKQMLAPFDPDRSAVVMNSGKPVGVVGEFKSKVRKKFKLPSNCAGFEAFLSAFKDLDKKYKPMSKFPETIQDICFKTMSNLSYAEIARNFSKALELSLPNDVNFSLSCIDIYQKDPDFKQTTFRVNFQSYERTLTKEIVLLAIDQTTEMLNKSINAERI